MWTTPGSLVRESSPEMCARLPERRKNSPLCFAAFWVAATTFSPSRALPSRPPMHSPCPGHAADAASARVLQHRRWQRRHTGARFALPLLLRNSLGWSPLRGSVPPRPSARVRVRAGGTRCGAGGLSAPLPRSEAHAHTYLCLYNHIFICQSSKERDETRAPPRPPCAGRHTPREPHLRLTARGGREGAERTRVREGEKKVRRASALQVAPLLRRRPLCVCPAGGRRLLCRRRAGCCSRVATRGARETESNRA